MLDRGGSYLERDGHRINLVMRRNTFYLPAVVSAVGASSGDARDEGEPRNEPGTSSTAPRGSAEWAAGPAREQQQKQKS